MAENRLPSRDRLQLVTGEAVVQWVAGQLNVNSFGPATAIGIAKDNTLIAGVVYHNYRHPSIEASIASISPKWANKSVLRAIFSYPFDQLKVSNLAVITDADNESVRNFLTRLGFKFVGILRKGNDTGDAAVYDMIPEECQWR